jgi:2-keto-4-pentenoate hydratase
MTINSDQAAKELLSRRVAGTKAPRLSVEQRPTTLEQALQIQTKMIEHHSSGVSGWKCLLPFDDRLIVAPIFSDVVQSGETCSLYADNGHARLEPEIAFVLGADLPASDTDYTDAQIDNAISKCHMALELIQSRYADDSGAEFPEALADGLVNQGLFLGPELNIEEAFAATTIDISVTQAGETQTFNGKHPNTQPVSPIYWLINFMTRRGVSFKSGQAIITGSYCGVVNVDFDQPTHIVYEGLGEYTVTFNDKK